MLDVIPSNLIHFVTTVSAPPVNIL